MTHLKTIGALLLLISFALPFSSCTHFEDAEGNYIGDTESVVENENAVEVSEYHFLYDSIAFDDISGWITLIGAFGPALMILLLFKWGSGPAGTTLRVAEILMLMIAVFMVYGNVFMSDNWEIGAYLASSGIVLYTISALYTDLKLIQRWISWRKTAT